MSTIVDDFQNYLVVELGLSSNTIMAYISDVQQLLAHNDWPDRLTGIHLSSFCSYLSRICLTPTTIKRKMSSLRTFCAFLVNCRGYNKAIFDHVESVRLRAVDKKSFLPLTLDRLPSIIDPANRLDRLLVTVLMSTGIRVSELCQLDVCDIDLFGCVLKIMAKGRLERYVAFGLECQIVIRDYLNHTGIVSGPLLSTPVDKRMDRFAIARRLALLGKRSGIGRLTPHMFRRHFASSLMQRGVPLEQIQRMLGHRSLAATQSYLLVDQEALRNVYKRCSPREVFAARG